MSTRLPMSVRSLVYSIVASVAIVILTWGSGAAQDPSYAWIRVESNLSTSLVLVDSVYMGRADQSLLRIPVESSTILLVPNVVGMWDLPQPEEKLVVSAGDTLSLVMNFPYRYRVDSVPFGASVSLRAGEAKVLGKTPLIYSTDEPLSSMLLLKKSGFANAEIRPGIDVINRHTVALQPLETDVAADDLAVEWAPRSSKNKWVTWAAAGLALTGGALAVNFKFKADDEYERYLESGDPEVKEQVDKLDAYSYVALGAMQIGVGVLAIRLAF